MKFYLGIALFLIVAALAAVQFADPNPLWRDVIVGLGGEFVADDADGRPCAHYGDTSEIVCFTTFPTWLGEDAKPYSLNGKPF